MKRTTTWLCIGSCWLLFACMGAVSDLDDLAIDKDACDPRGTYVRGTDLELRFIELQPHLNQEMKFAVTVGKAREVNSMFVLSTLNDPSLRLTIPKLLPGRPSELAFWADSMEPGFDPINQDGKPNDHQWTRPICPNGKLTFTHDTPFQDVSGAIATRAAFDFLIPEDWRDNRALFDNLEMWVRATQLASEDSREEVQTHVYFRWAPYVKAAGKVPEQRSPPERFHVGGALGEKLGPIDHGLFYRVVFVIDVDQSGDRTGDDFVCEQTEQAPDRAVWEFSPDLSRCDSPDGFAPTTYSP